MSFLSIYTQDYVNLKGVPAKIMRPNQSYPDLGDRVIKVKRSRSGEKRVLEENQRERMRTVYHVSYCRQAVEDALKPIKIGDEFMRGLGHTYSTDLPTAMPVPATLRRLFGYLRTEYLYEPLSTYQDEIGKPGYEWLTRVRGVPDIHQDEWNASSVE